MKLGKEVTDENVFTEIIVNHEEPMSRKSKAAEFVQDVWDISVTGRHVLVTEAMKNYAIDKISKIERFSNRVIDCQVIMDIQKLDHRIDLIIWADNTKIKASCHSDNMYASIDKACDKLKAQIRRYKERLQDHQSIGHADVAMTVNVYTPSDDIQEVNEDIEAENNQRLVESYSPHEIVKTETKPLKTLNYREAIVKMELSGDVFLIFRSEEDRRIKVIYRRDDGHFGVIAPEQ